LFERNKVSYSGMPNTKVAIRALRKSERNRYSNLSKKRVLKNVIKDVKKSIEEGDKEVLKTKLTLAYKKLDKAAKTNLIKKNKAARIKSRLAKKIK